MSYNCRLCGYTTKKTNLYNNHECIEETVVERFLRCLAEINIYPKSYQTNLFRTK